MKIEAISLSREYPSTMNGNFLVFEDISFTILPGEVTVLVGDNGCGKSSLLEIIAGLQPPNRGSISWDGCTAPPKPIAYMPQDYAASLLPWRSVSSNVALTRDSRSSPTGATQLPLWLELDPQHLTRSPLRLSGGQQQRVAIARSVATGSSLYVLDEPTSSLDSTYSIRVLSALRTHLKQTAAACVATLHDMAHAVLFADRIFLLKGSAPIRAIQEFVIASTEPRALTPDVISLSSQIQNVRYHG